MPPRRCNLCIFETAADTHNLQHLLTIPLVQDGVRAFSDNPIGKMSIQLSSTAYSLVAGPVLSLLNKPLSYVTPYVQRVDQLGDQMLSKVEEKYPVVKKPSPELYKDAKETVYAPVRHVKDVYNDAHQRNGGGFAVAHSKAAATTVVVVSAESAIFALRGAVDLTKSIHINEHLKKAADKLEAVVSRHQPSSSAPKQDTQSQAAPAKASNS
jgi:hypothetical protein